MPDQFAGQTIDIDPSQIVEFFAREVEDLRSVHDDNVNAFAVENIARPSGIRPATRLRLPAPDSQTNCAIYASLSGDRVDQPESEA